ncbi:hypothetical protein [Archangium lansingense]|uniref:Uncharacterized protein n=1 Tax=Archangium lansingense TaxID=2995310 RepID=A0ABT4AF29_9BACT|nr:hypothetical protein [Archangium lansinium]MCY1080295.1 hypothetical protein [Archangium lansinium]
MSLIAEDLHQTFHLRRFLGTEDNGRREVYGEPDPYPCRWQPGARRVQTVDGRQAVAQGTLFTTAQVSPEELGKLRIWLPGADPADYKLSRQAVQVFVRMDLETGAFDHSELVL